MAINTRLLKPGFISLMFVQFFGAANDNILKIVLTYAVAAGGIWEGHLGKGGQAYVGLCFTVPFILLSGFAGQIADRSSKKVVTLWVKLAEVGIALVGLAAFWLGNIWLALGSMLLLSIQSAFFGPAKYGMIPELVDDGDLSQANGSINMFTNIAVIVGTVVGGVVYGWLDPASVPREAGEAIPDGLPWTPGAVLTGVAVLGLVSMVALPRLLAMDPSLRIDWHPFRLYVKAIREMSRGPLILVACAWSFFYIIAWMALLILPDYRDLLQVSPGRASMLMGVLGVAIGIGSILAGVISGKKIQPRLIPVGAVGMTVFFVLLGLMPLEFGLVAALLTGAGIFAGFYIVPLQALLQHLSPTDERGRFLGTANAMSFVAGSLGTSIFLVAKQVFDLQSNKVFLICAFLALFGTGYLLHRMRKLIANGTVK